jgi:hypothetical protein
MGRAAMIVLLALFRVAKAADGTRNAKLSITVYRIHTSRSDSALARNLMAAQGVASGMFATAGVRVNWRSGVPTPDDPERPILIELTSNTPETFRPGALAFAYPFEGVHIRIFYDRVENVYDSRATVMILAHVMVHEIAHVLEGIDRHSKEGVMKSQWTLDDFKEMAYGPLPFDPEDVSLIRRGVVERREARRTSPSQRVP